MTRTERYIRGMRCLGPYAGNPSEYVAFYPMAKGEPPNHYTPGIRVIYTGDPTLTGGKMAFKRVDRESGRVWAELPVRIETILKIVSFPLGQ